MKRFALLEHDWNGIHYDLMLEREGSLRTWSFDTLLEAGIKIPARLRADHRLAYLDYEGPVTGHRGTVKCVARGWYRTVIWSPRMLVLAVQSPQLSGELRLADVGDAGWDLTFFPGKVD